MNSIPIPTPPPPTVEAFAWFLFTLYFTRAFCKELDQSIQATDWFRELPSGYQWILKRLLDLLHHWYIGLFIMIYAERITQHIPLDSVTIFWIGFAVLIDDVPDMPPRLREIFSGYKDRWRGTGEAG